MDSSLRSPASDRRHESNSGKVGSDEWRHPVSRLVANPPDRSISAGETLEAHPENLPIS
jgi:hypothetical protein